MSTDSFKMQVEGKWSEIKGQLKQKYADLTDDDVAMAEGKSEETMGRLQKKLGKTRAEIEHEISSFFK